MPFRNSNHDGTFRPTDLSILQKAYDECCILLDGRTNDQDDKDRVATAIIRTFEGGLRDPLQIAEKVAVIEMHDSVTSARQSDT